MDRALRERGEQGRRPRLLDYGCGTGFNLRSLPPRVNEWLYRLVAREARWVGQQRSRLPAGASLVARCAA